MKTKTTKTITAIAVLAAALTFGSCQKEKTVLKNTDNNATVSVSEQSEFEITNALDMAEGTYKTEGCAVITHDLSVMPHTFIIDYGTGCTQRDGKVRRGRITGTYDAADFSVTGVTINATFDNYFIDARQLVGTTVRYNNGNNNSHHITYSINSNIQVIEPNSGGSSSFATLQTLEILAGFGTASKADDVYSTTGTTNGTDLMGDNYVETITDPLIRKKDISCSRFFVQGSTDFQVGSQPVKTTNYGTGACDNLATLTVNGNTQNIILH